MTLKSTVLLNSSRLIDCSAVKYQSEPGRDFSEALAGNEGGTFELLFRGRMIPGSLDY